MDDADDLALVLGGGEVGRRDDEFQLGMDRMVGAGAVDRLPVPHDDDATAFLWICGFRMGTDGGQHLLGQRSHDTSPQPGKPP